MINTELEAMLRRVGVGIALETEMPHGRGLRGNSLPVNKFRTAPREASYIHSLTGFC